MSNQAEQTLTVYVPTEDSKLRTKIAPGSAIVGSEYQDTGRLRLDFEGNVYNLEELEEFEAKLQRAAERHLAHDGRGAETVACAYVDPEEVIAVGEYDVRSGEVTIHLDDLLQEWANRSEP